METGGFGAWLRDRLRSRAMTAAELARGAGVSPGTVSRWLGGSRLPTVALCYSIADALDLPPALVLSRAGHPTEDVVENETEDRLLALWRKLTPDGQDAVMQFVEFQRGRERAG